MTGGSNLKKWAKQGEEGVDKGIGRGIEWFLAARKPKCHEHAHRLCDRGRGNEEN